jgi:hypothetical protein
MILSVGEGNSEVSGSIAPHSAAAGGTMATGGSVSAAGNRAPVRTQSAPDRLRVLNSQIDRLLDAGKLHEAARLNDLARTLASQVY